MTRNGLRFMMFNFAYFKRLFGLAVLESAIFLANAQTRPHLMLSASGAAPQLTVSGDVQTGYCVETSSDCRLWDSLGVFYPGSGVFPNTTSYQLIDWEAAFNGQRFYRALATNVCQPASAAGTTVLLSDKLLSLYEGSSNTLTIQLSVSPPAPLTVSITRSAGSTNIVVAGGSNLLFTAGNWNIPQTVTVAAAMDADMLDSTAVLTVSTNGVAVTAVKVLAVDNDTDDEFVGPFASWLDARRDFGAKGDGVTDDTAALQNALNVIRFYTNRGVLYLPAGTYAISQTLNVIRNAHQESKDIMIIGADPVTTRILWTGATNGTMLNYGAWYAKLSRITFDGAGKVQTAISHGTAFSTYNEFSDLVIQDVAFGIRAGSGNAETAVERCKFFRCSTAAISLENPNSLDWFIWNTEFADCVLGVSNGSGSGGGNFHVYDCLFRRSTQADMTIGTTGYFSIRNNTSLGSAAFFTAGAVPSCGLVTLEGNVVVNPTGVPIQFGDYGPLVLIDNLFQDYQGLVGNIEPSAAFVCVGNIFTVSNAIPSGFDGPAGIRVDNVVACRKLPALLPRLPGVPPVRNRPLIDLVSPTNSTGLQAAINQAALLSGQRPVVHLPLGTCTLDQTVTIPAGCDLQMVGDGARSVLGWSGTNAGPVLRLAGPARATLRDFAIFDAGTTNQVECVTVGHCDQPGARVYADQIYQFEAQQIGFYADGCSNASVCLKNFYHSINQTGVKVKGGGGLPPFLGVNGQVAIFGGASSLNGLSYEVENGGKLVARDIWYEANGTNASGQFMICTNSGNLTLHGANIAPSEAQSNAPVVLASNFVGQLTFLTTEFTTSNSLVEVEGSSPQTALLMLGTLNMNYPVFNSAQAQTFLLQSFQTLADFSMFFPMSDTGPFGNSGYASVDYLRRMLSQTREAYPAVLYPLATALTDLRLFRVEIEGGTVGLHLTP